MAGLSSVTFRSRYLQHMTQGINHVIKACQVLVEAKQTLTEPEFVELCRDLKLSIRTQQRFLRIGEYEPFREESLHDRLPHAWGTLYELTCLDKDKFDSALVCGKISSQMTRQGVRKLLDAGKTGAQVSTKTVKATTSVPQSIVGRSVLTLSIDKDILDEQLVATIVEEVREVVKSIERHAHVFVCLHDHHAIQGIQDDLKADSAVSSVRNNLPFNEFRVLAKLARVVKNYCKHQLSMASSIEKSLAREGKSNQWWANEELIKCEPTRECVEYAFTYLGIDLDIDKCMFDEREVDRLLEKINVAGKSKQQFKF